MMFRYLLFLFVSTDFLHEVYSMSSVTGVNHGRKRNEMLVAKKRFFCPGCAEKKELKELESLSKLVDKTKSERGVKMHCMKGDKGDKGEVGNVGKELDSLVKPLEAKFEELKSSYTVEIARLKNEMHSLKSNLLHTSGSKLKPAISCKEIYQNDRSSPSGTYYLNVTETKTGVTQVYCSMDENTGCPAGSTLIMKIDGTKNTFRYSSPLWSNKDSYHSSYGTTIYDSHETKLPTYWSTPVSKVCVSMRVHSWNMDSLIIDHEATSFYDIISDGKYRPTEGNRRIWQSLLSDSVLQEGCLKQGFNVRHDGSTSSAAARIGAIAGTDCSALDSFVGLGTEIASCDDVDHTTISSGYHTGCHSDQHKASFAYVFVY